MVFCMDFGLGICGASCNLECGLGGVWSVTQWVVWRIGFGQILSCLTDHKSTLGQLKVLFIFGLYAFLDLSVSSYRQIWWAMKKSNFTAFLPNTYRSFAIFIIWLSLYLNWLNQRAKSGQSLANIGICANFYAWLTTHFGKIMLKYHRFFSL